MAIRDVNYRKQFPDTFVDYYPELASEVNSKYPKEDGKSGGLVKTITFVTTEACTLNCSYCYQVSKNHNAVMTKETAMKAVDMILDDSKMIGYINSEETPGIVIDFIGGEPLLNVELMDFVCDYFRFKAVELDHPWAYNHMFNFTSNGTRYFEEDVQKFIKKNAGRLSFTITIDGDKELHDSCRVDFNGEGSYDKVEAAMIHAMKNYGLDSSKITLAPENIMHTFKAIKHLSELGIHELSANVVYENVWVPERDAPIFYDQLIQLADWFIDEEKYVESTLTLFDESIGHEMELTDNNNWCGGNGQMLSIGTDGRLFPCIRFMTYSLNDKSLPEFEIGTVDKGIDSEEDNEFLTALAGITRTSQSTDKCVNCKVASGCAWCTGYNYDYYKTPNKRATFICEMHKTRVLANYYFWNKLYKKESEGKSFELNLSPEDIEFITKGDTRWQNF